MLHHLSLVELFRVMPCTSAQCLRQFCVCCEPGSMLLNSVCCRVFICHVESRCWKVVVHLIAVDIMFLLTTCNEGAVNGWCWLLGMCHILQMCSLCVRILLVKLKTLRPVFYILDLLHCVHYYDIFCLINVWQVNMVAWVQVWQTRRLLSYAYYYFVTKTPTQQWTGV
jgi:hypothetical protein